MAILARFMYWFCGTFHKIMVGLLQIIKDTFQKIKKNTEKTRANRQSMKTGLQKLLQ